MKEFTNNELKMFQATEGLITLSPRGITQIDWKSVEERLRNTKFDLKDIDGKSVNADDRAALIKDVNARKTNQESAFKLERVELGRAEKGNFITEMIDIKNGKVIIVVDDENREKELIKFGLKSVKNGKNDTDLTASYADRIKNSNMEDEDKKTLSNAFFTWQKSGINRAETTMGKNAQILANTMIAHGLIDTETERGFLSDLYAQELIEPEEYRTLNSLIDKNIKTKNTHKKPLYSNAVKMIAKELGDTNAGQLLQNATKSGDFDIMSLMGTMSKETYDSLNYFNLVLAEGEKEGYSYTEMLVDKSSKNYLMDNLVEYLKIAKDGKIDSSELQSEFAQLYDPKNLAIYADKPYHLGYSTFFQNKTPDIADLPVPLKKENESISSYLARSQKYLLGMNIKLPSTITGYQFENELDLNTIMITPEVDE